MKVAKFQNVKNKALSKRLYLYNVVIPIAPSLLNPIACLPYHCAVYMCSTAQGQTARYGVGETGTVFCKISVFLLKHQLFVSDILWMLEENRCEMCVLSLHAPRPPVLGTL